MSCTMEAVETVKVRPRRRRNADGTYTDSVKIMLTMREIQPLVHLPVHTAALSLGISSTTLKKKCRLVGMERWPYSRRGTTYSKSSSERSKKKEAPPTCESPLWFNDSMYPLWDPDAGTHHEVPAEGCDLCFLACDYHPRCGPL